MLDDVRFEVTIHLLDQFITMRTFECDFIVVILCKMIFKFTRMDKFTATIADAASKPIFFVDKFMANIYLPGKWTKICNYLNSLLFVMTL